MPKSQWATLYQKSWSTNHLLLMPLFYINYYHRVMFKKQVSWTDAGQKFVHPIRKGDIKKKITINAKCLMHAAALTRNIDSHCSRDTETHASHCAPPPDPSFLPTALLYNSTESQWNKAGYFKDLRAVIKNKLHFFRIQKAAMTAGSPATSQLRHWCHPLLLSVLASLLHGSRIPWHWAVPVAAEIWLLDSAAEDSPQPGPAASAG